MMSDTSFLLTVNAGSSSVKLELFAAKALQPVLAITAANISQTNAMLSLVEPGQGPHRQPLQAANHAEAVSVALDQMHNYLKPELLTGVGHRVVHGGQTFATPTVLTRAVVGQLQEMTAFDPEHMPAALEIIAAFDRRLPNVPQVGCFDTTFFRDLPDLARLLPLPRTFESQGLRRYGFHGLAYTSLLRGFGEIAGKTAAHGRVILAHLGSGASLAAVKDGKPLDTTMSFTPASGIPMSTRTGDLDPGIAAFLHKRAGMSLQDFNHMINFESGLLGISGLSADMELLIRESANNQRAAEAVDFFCYQVRKSIGSLATVLEGIDSLIFSGGIGENAPFIREKVCDGLRHLGISLDPQRNMNHEFLISDNTSRVGVHVMHADEAAVIAGETKQIVLGKEE